MCIGGIRALQHAEHPRVTVLVRRLARERRAAVERGLQLVLLGFFACLVVPAWRLTVSSAGERLPASGLSGAWMSLVLPIALVAMSVVLVQKLREESRAALPLGWTLGSAGLVIASVLVPLLMDAAPLAVLVIGFLVTASLGLPLAFTLALTSATYLLGHRRREPHDPADQAARRCRFLRAARDPALHPGGRAHGVGCHLRADRGSRHGSRRPRARRARDGGGRGRGALLRHLGLDGRGRVGDQLAAGAFDAPRRLLGRRGRERRVRGLGDGDPGPALPHHGRARLAREPLDRHPLPRRLPAGLPAGGAL